jgi:hypothetical protein
MDLIRVDRQNGLKLSGSWSIDELLKISDELRRIALSQTVQFETPSPNGETPDVNTPHKV